MSIEDDYPVPNLNTVTLAGKVPKAPGLTYRQDGVPVLRFLVVVENVNVKLNKTFKTTIPCELVGEAAERIGAELDAGDTVAISGRLAYRSTAEQTGGSLGVWCQLVQRLNPRAVMSAAS
jgi:single-stranded DNA-binding protein